jgi:hypothetical protein
MANRIWKEVQTPKHGVRKVGCKFFPAGTGAITGLIGYGIKSVARTGVGTLEITFEDKWQASQMVGFSPGVQHTTAVDLKAQLGDFTNGSSSVDAKVVLRLVAVATATDMAANANSSVSCEFTFQNNPRA